MEKIELKTCPFCGGESKIYVTDLGICVKCMNLSCRCQTESIVDLDIDSCKKYNALEYAVKTWNRRTDNVKNKC